ncbi:MAG: hypothetical protein AB1898_18180 [Acidobacteriota bacterium]
MQVQSKELSSYWQEREGRACPLCHGTGFRFLTRAGQTRALRCHCISQERVRTLQQKSGLWPSEWGQSLTTFTVRTARERFLGEVLRGFLNGADLKTRSRWILLCDGNSGRGVLRQFANELMRNLGYSCFWLDCSVDLERRGNKQQVIDRALGVDFLFVDVADPGSGRRSSNQLLERVLFERIRKRKVSYCLGPEPETLGEGDQALLSRGLVRMLRAHFQFVVTDQPHACQESRWLF